VREPEWANEIHPAFHASRTDRAPDADEKKAAGANPAALNNDKAMRLLAELLPAPTGQTDQSGPEEHHRPGLGYGGAS